MEDHKEIINSLLALLPVTDDNSESVLDHIRALRNACFDGPQIQNSIAFNAEILDFTESTLLSFQPGTGLSSDLIELLLWQLLAICIVSNQETQQLIWTRFGDAISSRCMKPPFRASTDIQLMIIYNVFKGGTGAVSEHLVLRCISQVWQGLVYERYTENLEFLHLCFLNFFVYDRSTVRIYAVLESTERIAFLDYIAEYLQAESPNGAVGTFLMQYFSKEFKIKSDCIMRSLAKDFDQEQPREAYGLLRVIAVATGSAQYSHVYSTDHSLFLNVSNLLRCLVAAGKEETQNIFTPLNKLEDVALASKTSHTFEEEMSFELKTLLVHCVANMLYENKINKGYCLDTELIPTLLECTNMDARNPLIKEWSILAIRNACTDSIEIQEIIANLNIQGMVKNDIVKDLNLEMGSLRLQ